MADDDKKTDDVEALKAQVAELTKGIEALKAKNDELLTETKAAKAAKREAEERAKAEAEELARKSGNIEALEKSWQEKLAKAQADAQRTIDALQGSITTMTVDNVAVRLANEIAVPGSADILIPHIKARLAAEQRDGQFVTVVRDAQGKPSAASLDDLKTEFTTSPAFAPVIVGSKASGGGAGGGSKGGGAAPKGDLGGSREERLAAIAAQFPDLKSA